MSRVLDAARAAAVPVVWLAIVVLVALGGAGLVAAMDHVPGTTSRAELTWTTDEAAQEALDVATARLETLAGDVGALSRTARLALTQLAGQDVGSVEGTIIEGDGRLAVVQLTAAALASDIGAVPGTGPDAELRLSPVVRHRYAELTRAPGVTDGLAADWAVFAGRTTAAARLTTLLALHDEQAAAAAKEGVAGRYLGALEELARAEASLADARALGVRLAPTTDVSTLNRWLDLNGAYDAALRELYEATIEADGVVTPRLRDAVAAERRARAALPGDTRAIVVIMAEVARGGMNQAVISIEDARGMLEAALQVQRELSADEPLPG